MLDKLKLVINL